MSPSREMSRNNSSKKNWSVSTTPLSTKDCTFWNDTAPSVSNKANRANSDTNTAKSYSSNVIGSVDSLTPRFNELITHRRKSFRQFVNAGCAKKLNCSSCTDVKILSEFIVAVLAENIHTGKEYSLKLKTFDLIYRIDTDFDLGCNGVAFRASFYTKRVVLNRVCIR